MMRVFYVYIMASKRDGTLYVGMTSNLLRRVYEHKQGMIEGIAKRYGVKMLVYYERYSKTIDAINREKCLKKWNRAWKVRIIEKMNPEWKDLSKELF